MATNDQRAPSMLPRTYEVSAEGQVARFLSGLVCLLVGGLALMIGVMILSTGELPRMITIIWVPSEVEAYLLETIFKLGVLLTIGLAFFTVAWIVIFVPLLNAWREWRRTSLGPQTTGRNEYDDPSRIS